jgi:hypothetical protein
MTLSGNKKSYFVGNWQGTAVVPENCQNTTRAFGKTIQPAGGKGESGADKDGKKAGEKGRGKESLEGLAADWE